jgi:hypothetical protein
MEAEKQMAKIHIKLVQKIIKDCRLEWYYLWAMDWFHKNILKDLIKNKRITMEEVKDLYEKICIAEWVVFDDFISL